jgi:CRP-like cAMP-binding protein
MSAITYSNTVATSLCNNAGDNSSSHARGLVFDDVSTDTSTTTTTAGAGNTAAATVVTVNEGVVSDELRHSSTTVRAVSDCQVYAWDFHLLRAYLKRHPLEGNAMQVSISADLTRKLDQSRDASHRLVPVC